MDLHDIPAQDQADSGAGWLRWVGLIIVEEASTDVRADAGAIVGYKKLNLIFRWCHSNRNSAAGRGELDSIVDEIANRHGEQLRIRDELKRIVLF